MEKSKEIVNKSKSSNDAVYFDPYLKCLPRSSFSIIYWYLQHGRMDDFEKELEKKEADEDDLIVLLESSILKKNKVAFKLLIKYGASLKKIDQKTLSKIPMDFLDY